MKKIISIFTFLLLCLVSVIPYGHSIVNAQVNEQNGRVLLIYSKVDKNQLVKSILSNKTDESLLKVQSVLNKGKFKLTYSKDESFTDVVADVEEVRNSSEMREYLHKQLVDGKMVFLYGGITFHEYKELLGLEKLIVDMGNDIRVDLGITKEPVEKKLKNTSIQPPIYDIIGYSLKDLSVNVATISVDNQNNIPTDYHYLHGALNMLRTKVEDVNDDSIGILADPGTIVRSKYNIIAYAYTPYGALAGQTTTDYTLYRNFNETDSTYDYFRIEDVTQVQGYNGFTGYSLNVKHDIPFSSDEIRDWGPLSSSSSPYTISLGYPWNITFTFNMTGNPSVTNTASLANNWTNWYVTNRLTRNLNGVIFRPQTAWASTGTYAGIDLVHSALFHNGFEAYSADGTIQVRYDY